MTTFSGTIDGIKLVRASDNGVGARKVYEIACSFTQSFTAGDVARLVSVDTAVQTAAKNGRTFTVRGIESCQPGTDASATAVYPVAPYTNSSSTITFGLGGVTTNAAATGSITGVRLLVIGDES